LGSREIEKFNPNHDPDNGQFTSGDGGSGANDNMIDGYDKNNPLNIAPQIYLPVSPISGIGAAIGEGAAAAAAIAEKQEVESLIETATKLSGNDGVFASSRDIANNAAESFVGNDAMPIYDRTSGEQIGKISSDGNKIARYTSLNKDEPYINLENKQTSGNLHVRWKND